jgi:putative ABC transport system permease protein
MALWTMILRKMANNKWLQLNLWFGLTVCVALFSSMPLYSHAVLQRTLYKELQLLQETSNVYPGFVRIGTSVSAKAMSQETIQAIERADVYVKNLPGRLGLDVKSFYQQRSTQNMKVYGADASEEEIKAQNVYGNFKTVTDLEKRVRLIDGRMPNPKRNDGVYEALVTQKFLISLKRDINEEITGLVSDTKQKYRVLPVGIVDNAVEADPYLPYMVSESKTGFMIPFDVFERDFTRGGNIKVSTLDWRFALDYSQLKVENLDNFTDIGRRISNYFQMRLGISDIQIPALEPVKTYGVKKQKLDVMLLSLYSPVMLMLAFYLYMAANLIIERQKTDISVLRSRGASRLQIMLGYTVESLLLGLSALAVGPFLGMFFTKILGSSNGFLEFVQRSALEVSLNSSAYKVAAAAVGGALVLILIPAFLATRVSIVGHKQEMARMNRMSFWHKTGLDVILIAVAVYLLYSFNQRQDDLRKLALDSDALQVDPLLFLMPALFALGGGLLVLRVYPWFIRLIYWLGRKWWSPALYNTLIQISRSSGQYLTIKVFLIMTVATGLFSANSARTINENMQNKIQYSIGSDIALTTQWENDAPPPAPPGAPPAAGNDTDQPVKKRVQYTEPPFLAMAELKGVEAAARVFAKEGVSLSADSGGTGMTTLYGIDTYDFGRTAWMMPGLMEYHINNYLNVIASDPKAVLISRSVADEFKVKPGDPIRISWDELDQAVFSVYGIIDYWPGWNPLPKVDESGAAAATEPFLVVGHLDTIQNHLALEPYNVWLKLKDGVSSQQIYDELTAKNIPVLELKDAGQELIRSKNDPFRLAINGVMTLGFVISMLISFFGFLLFWMLTLSGRTLQYGVLRAMGIPFRQIIGMLISEQLLTSGAAVLIGVLIGNAVSEMFVPLFEMSFSTSEQVPPFKIIYHLSDYIQLYSIVGFMLTVGLLVLGYRLSRVRISQALKLGEE